MLIAFSRKGYSVNLPQADTIKIGAGQPLILSGSADVYYKYDLSGIKTAKGSNIPTIFANEQNSFSLGMLDIALKKKVNKATLVGELSFGPRSDQYLPVPDYHIQNLYIAYDLTNKLTITGGYMAAFIGYEVFSPAVNFNYSTSYLFTNTPFQNAGLKATYAFSDKISLMAGAFNDQWNVYQSQSNVSTFGAQLILVPVKDWTVYINLLTGNNKTPTSGTVIDLTSTYQISDSFKLGLNGSNYSASNGAGNGGFYGMALYPQLTVAKDVTLGLRGEYFKSKTGTYTSTGPPPGSSVTGLTFTANIKDGPLTLIPEIRLDSGSKSMFLNSSSDPTKSAAQFLVAAVYIF